MNWDMTVSSKNKIWRVAHQDWVTFALFFCLSLFILHGLPLVLDDNGFKNLSFESTASALHYVLGYGNGRVLGNGGIIFLLHHEPLGDFVRAALIAGIAMLLPAILQLKRKFYQFLSMFLLLGIAPAVFGQSFSWMSGFQNYVPPVFLFLCGLRLTQLPAFSKPLYGILVRGVVFLCGFCMQLYIEHSSCINLLLAMMLVLYSWKANKEKDYKLKALLFFAASFIGLFLMLMIMKQNGSEPVGHTSYFSGTGLRLIYGVVRNGSLIISMFSENAVLLMVLAALRIVLMWRYKQSFSQGERTVCSIILMAMAFSLLLQLIVGFRTGYGKLLAAETVWILIDFTFYIIISAFIDIRIIRIQSNRIIRNSLILSVFSACGLLPLLLIWPVGYRCLFHSYVLLCASGLLLAEEIVENNESDIPYKIVRTASLSAFCVVVLCLSFLFVDIRRMISIRNQYLEEEAKKGVETVAYFTIPTQYIYDAWNEEYEHFATIEGNTIQLEIMPVDVWLRMHYYHYS